jgi:hypothetical protein
MTEPTKKPRLWKLINGEWACGTHRFANPVAVSRTAEKAYWLWRGYALDIDAKGRRYLVELPRNMRVPC